MATDYGFIKTMSGKVLVNRFFGGDKNGGSCVQLTPENGDPYIQLSAGDCFKLFNALNKVFDVDTIREDYDG